MRWMGEARVSMQRLAAPLAVTAASSESRATSLSAISGDAAALLQRHVAAPSDRAGAVLEYVQRLRLWKERYPHLRGVRSMPEDLVVEAQDLWLADPAVPSATGAITVEAIDEPPQLAANLRLVRPKNFTRTDRGRALLALAEGCVASLRSGAPEPNPIGLSPGSRALLLYAILEADLDFVRAAYEVTLERKGAEFTRPTFGECLPEACRRLRERWLRKVRSGEERRQVDDLARLAKTIEETSPGPWGKPKTWGGGRARDQTGTVRLEPYVDLGVVTRKNRFEYTYLLNDRQAGFFKRLIDADAAEEFLDEQLFAVYLGSLGVDDPAPATAEEIWDGVTSAYAILRSQLGYASFKEVVLLAIGRLLDRGEGRYFEVAHGIDVIRAQQRADPRTIRFGIMRGGGLTYMKIVESGRGR
jgi:hypothetical protein